MKAKIRFKGKEILIEDIRKCSFFWRFKGLMFTNPRDAQALLFEFNKKGRQAIHSYFVRFPFIAIWLDEEGKIMEYKVISSRNLSIKPEKEFAKLIEVPITSKYQAVFDFFSK
ncbi:MAG: DUF192 domain-containing protein [archaeon]